MITTLPNVKDVRDLYNDLLGRNVDIVAIDAWTPEPFDGACAAEFVGDNLQLLSVAVLDLPLAVYTGAAIGLVPAGGAKDMVKERDPSEMVISNLYEVLNVLTSVFNTADNPHVRIATLHKPLATFPPDVARIAARPSGRVDLSVDISGYGKGRLALISA